MRRRWLAVVLFAAATMAGCDDAFDPYDRNGIGPFSVFGYLDTHAETQWIRVMPIRNQLIPDPAPIDAVVTLEDLGTGRVLTLRDSVFAFTDRGRNAVLYAHNFWTTETIEAGTVYRLTAMRSDGAATTAVVETPPESELTLRFLDHPRAPGVRESARVFVRGEHLLYAEVIYTVRDTKIDRGGSPVPVRQISPLTPAPGTWEFAISRDSLHRPGLEDVRRLEARVAVSASDWPFEPGLSAAEVAVPGAIPTNVENGVGALLGVATWTIPLPNCIPLAPGPDGAEECTTVFDGTTASVVGRVVHDPCGNLLDLPFVRLTERYADGGAVAWEWKADWTGAYRFEGLEPGAELIVELPGVPGSAVAIPPLQPGQRYEAPDLTIPRSCPEP